MSIHIKYSDIIQYTVVQVEGPLYEGCYTCTMYNKMPKYMFTMKNYRKGPEFVAKQRICCERCMDYWLYHTIMSFLDGAVYDYTQMTFQEKCSSCGEDPTECVYQVNTKKYTCFRCAIKKAFNHVNHIQ